MPPLSGWRKIVLISARIVLLAYFGFGALLYFGQRLFLYYPEMGVPDACSVFGQSGVVQVTEGATTLYSRPGGEKLLVFYHGNAGTACDRKFLADYFSSKNIGFIFVEYAGYGSAGKASEDSLKVNVRDADRFLEKLEFDELIIMGESLGTNLAAYHATLRAPEKLLLLSPYTSMADVAAAHYPIYPVRFLLKDRYATDWGGRNLSGKLLAIHGMEDDIIPSSIGEAFFRNAPFARKELLLVETAGHNDLYGRPAVWDKISEFIASEE